MSDVKTRQISLASRFEGQIKWTAILMLVTIFLGLVFSYNVTGLLVGYALGTIFWPLFYHSIRFGERR